MSRDELTNTAWLYLLLKCHNICTCCIVISRYEEEAIPIEVLQVCNNSVTDITCRDEKGEPFSHTFNRTSGDNGYMYTCSPELGARCWTIKNNASCQDYALRVYCECPSRTTRGMCMFEDSNSQLKKSIKVNYLYTLTCL